MSLLRNIFIVLFLLLNLSACGFTPIYSEASLGGALKSRLDQIKVKPIAGKFGQTLRLEILDIFQQYNEPQRPDYVLKVNLKQKEEATAIEQDRQITRYNVIVTADYTLNTDSAGESLDKGSVKLVGSYDAVESEFATYVAKQAAIERITKEIAQELKHRVVASLLNES